MVMTQWLFIFAICLTLAWVVSKVFKRRRALVYSIKQEIGLGHRWLACQFAPRPSYCTSCLQFCVSGNLCEICGACVCPSEECLKSANKSNTCKPLTVKEEPEGRKGMRHKWVRGNLPLLSECTQCFTPCGDRPELADFRCLWCQKTVHEYCVDENSQLKDDDCTFGPYRQIIIPPTSVTVREEGWRGKKRLVVTAIKPPEIENWRPLVVFANPRSGGKDGEEVIRMLRSLLNPVQVVDLTETPPKSALEMCRLIPDTPTRVMVCGGDGTVGWVLSAIDEANLPLKLHVGILPLGTGNDLARVLGWGPGYSDDEDISELLREYEHAVPSLLDRWKVNIKPKSRYLGIRNHSKVLTMNNYLGVGCDAGVALNFHRQRESKPQLFTSRLINKAWYVGFGARDVIEQSCKDLPNKVELYLDGVPQSLKNLEGIVVLNINSWSSGCTVWRDPTPQDNWMPSRFDDEQLELVGLYSSFHVGKIQVSVAEPVKIGQAKNIQIVLNQSVPVQVDGEPWQQGACTIDITHQGQSHMLRRKVT